jgi:hypothetical protein
MRTFLFGFLMCSVGTIAVGQCPIQPHQASFDSSGKNVTFRYYNLSSRDVRGIGFVVTTTDTSRKGRAVVGNFSTRSMVHPKQEGVSVFPVPGGVAFDGNIELEIRQVSFADHSTWSPPHNNTCKIEFTEE